MCTFKHKAQIKKLALSGLQPKEIERKLKKEDKNFDWTNVRIGQWLYEQKLNKKSEKIQKITEKMEEKEIEKIAEKKSKIDYDVEKCFQEFEEIRQLALTPNPRTGAIDLANALKAIENKAKIKGHFLIDNIQKTPPAVEHNFKIF